MEKFHRFILAGILLFVLILSSSSAFATNQSQLYLQELEKNQKVKFSVQRGNSDSANVLGAIIKNEDFPIDIKVFASKLFTGAEFKVLNDNFSGTLQLGFSGEMLFSAVFVQEFKLKIIETGKGKFLIKGKHPEDLSVFSVNLEVGENWYFASGFGIEISAEKNQIFATFYKDNLKNNPRFIAVFIAVCEILSLGEQIS